MVFLPDDRSLFREYGDIVMPISNGGRGVAYLDPTDTAMKALSFYESDIFKNLVNLKRKWYEMGLLPKPNQIKDQEVAFSSGQLGAIWSVVLKTTERIDAFKKASPDARIEDVFLNPDKPKYIYEAASNLLSLFSTSQSPKQAIAFVDWFRSSQENYDLMSYGAKDVNYKLDGNAVIIDGIDADKGYNQIYWAWDDINFKRFSKEITPEYVERLKNWDKDAVAVPSLGFKFDVEPVKAEIAQINALEEEYAVPALNGYTAYDEFFPDFQKKLKSAGLDKVLAEMQRQLDEFKAAK
jgi:putative aldouronate transport system substrate-binding protein